MRRSIRRLLLMFVVMNFSSFVLVESAAEAGRTKVSGRVQKKTKYGVGKHGNKKQEQKRLIEKYKKTVSGDTHESEHPIGVHSLIKTSGVLRGDNKQVKDLENNAPAYQEQKSLHKAHVGTGPSSSKTDDSGFSPDTYRLAQRELLEAADVSTAVQLNQLGYAFDPNFKKTAGTVDGQIANDSFDVMVREMNSVSYAQGTSDFAVQVTPEQQAEMYLSRRAALTGKWPTPGDIEDALNRFRPQ